MKYTPEYIHGIETAPVISLHSQPAVVLILRRKQKQYQVLLGVFSSKNRIIFMGKELTCENRQNRFPSKEI
jgi:hypothetical protein